MDFFRGLNVMRIAIALAATMLVMNASRALDLDDLKSLNKLADKPLLENANKALADQQIKDGQFEFKTGKAEFAPGNESRFKGLVKILADNSKTLKTAFPKLKVTAEGHTDADGKPEANMKLSLSRATKCARRSRPRE
ncbi:MAG: hypothetical protein EXR36_03705 [Betaproteobacteria bacterium]|nr:hypothetical protein [Betaproteobacteria bacterium]